MRGIFIILQFLCLGLVTACQNHSTEPQAVAPDPVSAMHTQFGMAAIYSDHRTASGERFNAASHTGAHRTWPMGCRVRVTHLGTGRQVIVRINDRGPYTRGWVQRCPKLCSKNQDGAAACRACAAYDGSANWVRIGGCEPLSHALCEL
jgi:hypothetical protein